MALLDDQQLHSAMADRPSWQILDGALTRSVQAPDFLTGIDLVSAVARAAEDADHHPDIDIRWTTVVFRLVTHSEGGITHRDVELAATIDDLVDARIVDETPVDDEHPRSDR